MKNFKQFKQFNEQSIFENLVIAPGFFSNSEETTIEFVKFVSNKESTTRDDGSYSVTVTTNQTFKGEPLEINAYVSADGNSLSKIWGRHMDDHVSKKFKELVEKKQNWSPLLKYIQSNL